MPGRNPRHPTRSGLLVRYPFEVADPDAFAKWHLRVRHDAGLVVWLNGVEILRRLAPEPAGWDATATAERPDQEALQWIEVPLAAAPPIAPGGNLLAVHALNSDPADEDLLVEVQLEGEGPVQTREAYFPAPTPGAPNGSGVAGFVEPVRFSVPRGFYDEPFEVELDCPTPGATIRYTTDGSAPAPDHGRLFDGPIRITTTTTLQAAAFREDFAPAPPVTHTYIFLDDVLRQPDQPPGFPDTWTTRDADYGMDARIVEDPVYGPQMRAALRSHPTLSLVMDLGDLFDPQRGIYSNSQTSGDAWERPVSAEFFGFPDGRQIQVNAGLRLQGNASRSPSRPKHNMRLTFRRRYGPGRLDFPLFPGTPVHEFDDLILRGQNGDSWIHPNANQRERAQYIRDQWHRDVRHAMGHPTLLQGHFHLYINGLYWGFYHVFERAEAETFAAHFGGDESEYDLIHDYNRRPGEVEAIDGDTEAWDAMMALAAAHAADPDVLQLLRSYLDLENFVDYMLLNFYSGNTDWDGSNWRAARRRLPGEGFRFYCWDSERTVGDSAQPTLVTDTDVTTRNVANRATGLHQMLRVNPEYRLFFADRVQRHCFGDGVLTPARAAALWQARVDEIRLPLIAEAARWGDSHRPEEPYDPEDEWMAEVRRLVDSYFPVRTAILLNQLRAQGLYPSLSPPGIVLPDGPLELGDRLQLTHPDLPGVELWHTLDGADPRLPGGQPNPSAREGAEVLLWRAGPLKVRARRGAEWSALVERPLAVRPPHHLPDD